MASLFRAGRRNKGRPFPSHILVFLAPAAFIYTLFAIYPVLDSLRLGFFTQGAAQSEHFVGLDNFVRLATEATWQPRLLAALGNSFVFFLINMLVQNPIALALAAVLSGKTRGSGLYRTLIFAPAVLSLVIVAFVWEMLLSPLWGVIKNLLIAVGLGGVYQPWLGLPETSLITLGLISSWQYLGVPMMLYYAAFISIPHELTEAAIVDGANGRQIFWRVRLPLVMPMVGIVSLMTYIFNFNAFDVIYAVKGPLAGPNFASDTMMTFFYRTFFGFEFQPPNPTMGAAIAGVIFVILIAGVALYFLFWQRRVHTYEM